MKSMDLLFSYYEDLQRQMAGKGAILCKRLGEALY